MRTVSPLISGSLAMVLALAAGACSRGEAVQPAPASDRGGANAIVPVATATVVDKAVPLQLSTIGTAEAYSNVAVRAQLTGELTAVLFKEGEDVRKGQVLFTLDRRPLEAALRQAKANLARDEAQAANARSSAARYQDLADRGIATKEQIDQTRTAAAALEATVGADRATVENATVQLAYATISAPLSGRTGALQVHEGNLVRANDTTPLVLINQITPIYVGFGIPESRLPALKQYLARGTVKVEALAPNDPGEPSRGAITFVDNAVDQSTGMIKIKAMFPNSARHLWPGQFANVVVTLTTDAHAIVVPTPAVQSGQQGQYVFVVKRDQTVELRPVTVARATDIETVIEKGLTPGETIVTDGQLRLIPGSRVSVKSGPGAKTTP